MFNFDNLTGIDIEEYQERKEQRRIEQEKLIQYKQEKYGKPGIYCIKINGKIVYIGKSIYMLSRVEYHKRYITSGNGERKYKILNQAINKGYRIEFDVLYYSPRKMENAIKNDIGKKEGVYIRRYKPCLNTQIPKIDDWHKWDLNPIARDITFEEFEKSLR